MFGCGVAVRAAAGAGIGTPGRPDQYSTPVLGEPEDDRPMGGGVPIGAGAAGAGGAGETGVAATGAGSDATAGTAAATASSVGRAAGGGGSGDGCG